MQQRFTDKTKGLFNDTHIGRLAIPGAFPSLKLKQFYHAHSFAKH